MRLTLRGRFELWSISSFFIAFIGIVLGARMILPMFTENNVGAEAVLTAIAFALISLAMVISFTNGTKDSGRLLALTALHDHLGLSEQFQQLADEHLAMIAKQLDKDFEDDRVALKALLGNPNNLELRRKAGAKHGTAHATKEAFWDFHKTVRVAGLKTRKSYKDYLPNV